MTCGKGAKKKASSHYLRGREGKRACKKIYSEVNSWVGESSAFGMRCLMHQRLPPLAYGQEV